jgi:cold shock CspA family protein
VTPKGKMISLISKPSKDEKISKEIYYGYLKFFLDDKDYGFLVMEPSKVEIFVHRQQLMQAGIDLTNPKRLPPLRFSFKIAKYSGKKGPSQKAVCLCLIGL